MQEAHETSIGENLVRECATERSSDEQFLQGFLKPHLGNVERPHEAATTSSASLPLLRETSKPKEDETRQSPWLFPRRFSEFFSRSLQKSAVRDGEVEMKKMDSDSPSHSFCSRGSRGSTEIEEEPELMVHRSSFTAYGTQRFDWEDYGFGGIRSAIACGFIFVLVVVGLAALMLTQTRWGYHGKTPLPSDEVQMQQEQRKYRGDAQLGFLSGIVKKWHLGGSKHIGRIFGASFNTRGDLNALCTSMLVAISLGASALCLPYCMRKRFPLIYDGRRNEIKGIADRLYSTVGSRVKDEEADRIIQGAGLDCWMLLQFHTLCCRFTFLVGSVLVVTLLPIHFCNGPNNTGVLSRFSVNNIKKEYGNLFYIHAILVNYVVIIGATLLVRAHRRFLEFRFAWLSALPRPRATTLMVENLPIHDEHMPRYTPPITTDAGLLKHFQHLFGEDAIERTYVLRKTKSLKNLVKDTQEIQDKILFAHEKWQRAGGEQEDRPTLSVDHQEHDEIAYFENSLYEAEALVEEERRRLEQAMEDNDFSVSASAGFVTFKSRSSAVLAVQMQYTEDAAEFEMTFAPEPDDVIYDDLIMEPMKQKGRIMLGRLSLVVFFLSCAPIMFLVSQLVRMETIERWCQPVYRFIQKHPAARAVMQGVITTAILKGFVIVLPKILLTIITKFYCLKAGSWAQVKLQKWYFAFQTIFLVLAMACGDSIIGAAARVLEDPLHIFTLLDSTMPLSSHTYLNFVVMGTFLRIFELLRATTLIKYYLYRAVMGRDDATKRAQQDDAAFHGMGTRMVKTATTANMAIVFCMIDPLICLFSWVYFSVGRTTYKYLMVHSERKKADLGGVFWVEALSQTFFSLGLFCMLMVGVLGVRAPNFWPAAIAACSSLVLIVRILEFKRLAWKSLPYEKVVDLDKNAHDTASRVTKGEYIQPEIAHDLIMRKRSSRTRNSAIFGEVAFAAKSVQMAAKSFVSLAKRSSIAPTLHDGAMSSTPSTSSRRSIVVDTRRASLAATDPLTMLAGRRASVAADPLMGRQASIASEHSPGFGRQPSVTFADEDPLSPTLTGRRHSVMFAPEELEAFDHSASHSSRRSRHSQISSNDAHDHSPLPLSSISRRRSQVVINDSASFCSDVESKDHAPSSHPSHPDSIATKSILKRANTTESLDCPTRRASSHEGVQCNPDELKRHCAQRFLQRSEDGSLKIIVERVARHERRKSHVRIQITPSFSDSYWSADHSPIVSPETSPKKKSILKRSRSCRADDLKRRFARKLIQVSQDGSFKAIVEKAAQNRGGRNCRSEELRRHCAQTFIERSQDGGLTSIVERVARNERG